MDSTSDVCKRWASTKKACLDEDSANNGLYKHFKTGCPADKGDGDLGNLTWTLVDFVETSELQLTSAGHQGGPKCRCRMPEVEGHRGQMDMPIGYFLRGKRTKHKR